MNNEEESVIEENPRSGEEDQEDNLVPQIVPSIVIVNTRVVARPDAVVRPALSPNTTRLLSWRVCQLNNKSSR